MNELKFEKRESDYLILAAQDGSESRVAITEELKQAVRRTPVETSRFSPAEIQKQIRAGATISEVATNLGISSSAVEPFAAPVFAEIDYLKQNALNVRLAANEFDYMIRLEDLIIQRWGRKLEFQLRKTDDGWLLVANTDTESASWIFEPRSNTLKPWDDAALELAGDYPAGPSLAVITSKPDEMDKPEEPEQPPSVATDLLEELQRRRAAKTESQKSETSASETKKGRPSVPSWDEIVFGTNSETDSD